VIELHRALFETLPGVVWGSDQSRWHRHNPRLVALRCEADVFLATDMVLTGFEIQISPRTERNFFGQPVPRKNSYRTFPVALDRRCCSLFDVLNVGGFDEVL